MRARIGLVQVAPFMEGWPVSEVNTHDVSKPHNLPPALKGKAEVFLGADIMDYKSAGHTQLLHVSTFHCIQLCNYLAKCRVSTSIKLKVINRYINPTLAHVW